MGETSSPADYPELPAKDRLWGIFQECWEMDPTMRPTMEEILAKLSVKSSLDLPPAGISPAGRGLALIDTPDVTVPEKSPAEGVPVDIVAAPPVTTPLSTTMNGEPTARKIIEAPVRSPQTLGSKETLQWKQFDAGKN